MPGCPVGMTQQSVFLCHLLTTKAYANPPICISGAPSSSSLNLCFYKKRPMVMSCRGRLCAVGAVCNAAGSQPGMVPYLLCKAPDRIRPRRHHRSAAAALYYFESNSSSMYAGEVRCRQNLSCPLIICSGHCAVTAWIRLPM